VSEMSTPGTTIRLTSNFSLSSLSMFKPELLAPAGSLEKLKVAVLYGADAVFFSGQRYSLRARADNFTEEELKEGIAFAQRHGVKTYITLNAFLHDDDLEGLDEFCQLLDSLGVTAVIVSDLGVIDVIQKSSKLAVHLSTQASCLNAASAMFWKAQGVERIVLGREVSIQDAAEIKAASGLEMEMFIHGAMCMAYSGNCVISNYTAGRDSNRGGCIQSCRFQYQQIDPKTGKTADSFFMSSKDMSGLQYIPEFCRAQIDSLKIEGRMKSLFYVASLCRAYRRALDLCTSGEALSEELAALDAEINSVPHRDYFGASFTKPAGSLSVFQDRQGTIRSGTHQFTGLVLEKTDKFAAVRLYAPMTEDQTIEILPFRGAPIPVHATEVFDLLGNRLSSARQDCVVCIPLEEQLAHVEPLNIVRAQRS
jgi:putative protease